MRVGKGENAQVVLPRDILGEVDGIAKAALSTRSAVIRNLVAEGVRRRLRPAQAEGARA